MEKKFQVFVSSTYSDLILERQQVMQALLELDCIPVGMELFQAADDDQWTLITDLIKDCDYYLLIVAGKYGTIHPSGMSYTEKEYRYALEAGIPIISFLIKDPDTLAQSRCEKDSDIIFKLNNFKELVQLKFCRYWESPVDLGSKVSRSLVQLIKKKPRPGWVKFGESNQDDMKEIISLNKRVENLTKENKIYKKNEDFYKDIIRTNIISFGKIIKDTKTALYDEMFQAVELSFKFSDKNLNQILDSSLNIITDSLVDILNNQIRTKQGNEEISVSVKAFVNEHNVKKILEEDLIDNLPTNIKQRYIITLARDTNTRENYSEREVRRDHFDVRKNSSFNRIVGGEDYFISNDLKEDLENGAYVNESSEWMKYYNATAVVPIYYRAKGDDEKQIFGFLAVDSLNLSGGKIFNKKDTIPILEFGAELLTIIFLNLGLFVKKQKENHETYSTISA